MNFSIYKKKYRPKIIFVLVFFFSLFSSSVLGQKVAIKDVIQKDQQVHVYYTLEGNSVYEVNLYFVLDEGVNGWTRAQIVSGDVGEKQKGGVKTKLIVWDVIADKGELVGKCDFMVDAIDIKAQEKALKTENKRSKKQKKDFAASRAPKNSIFYLRDPSRPFGLSYSRLNHNSIGGYFDFFSFSGGFPPTSYLEIDNNGFHNHPGNIDYSTREVTEGSYKITLGITSKVPNIAIWGYGGIGLVVHKRSESYDIYFPASGDYWEREWFKNTNQSNTDYAFEFGVKSKLGKCAIRAGLINSNNSSGIRLWSMQVGIGILY